MRSKPHATGVSRVSAVRRGRTSTVVDCVDGYVCNGKNECVKQLEAPELSSCAASGRPVSPKSALAALALGALALVRRRRS